VNHERVEIHRQYGRGPDRAETMAIGEPSGLARPRSHPSNTHIPLPALEGRSHRTRHPLAQRSGPTSTKKGRLGAAEIVGSIPVGHVSVAVDLKGKVLEHVEREVVATIRFEAQHGEIGIPIVELTESATRHDIRIALVSQVIPEPCNVCVNRFAR